MRQLRRALAIAAVVTPLLWVLLLTWVTRLFAIREGYLRLWQEYDAARNLFDQTHAEETGKRIADLFEYMSVARGDYMVELHTVLVGAILPAMAIWFVISLRAAWQAGRDFPKVQTAEIVE